MFKLCLAAALALAVSGGRACPRARRGPGRRCRQAEGARTRSASGSSPTDACSPTAGRPQHLGILTPDKAGNYATGTWKAVANSAHARGGAQQHVLKDGRFFVGGGEYIDGPACTRALLQHAREKSDRSRGQHLEEHRERAARHRRHRQHDAR